MNYKPFKAKIHSMTGYVEIRACKFLSTKGVEATSIKVCTSQVELVGEAVDSFPFSQDDVAVQRQAFERIGTGPS